MLQSPQAMLQRSAPRLQRIATRAHVLLQRLEQRLRHSLSATATAVPNDLHSSLGLGTARLSPSAKFGSADAGATSEFAEGFADRRSPTTMNLGGPVCEVRPRSHALSPQIPALTRTHSSLRACAQLSMRT